MSIIFQYKSIKDTDTWCLGEITETSFTKTSSFTTSRQKNPRVWSVRSRSHSTIIPTLTATTRPDAGHTRVTHGSHTGHTQVTHIQSANILQSDAGTSLQGAPSCSNSASRGLRDGVSQLPGTVSGLAFLLN